MKPAIYTEQAACQDCYKCVRECPVKAIEVKDGHAVVVQDLCLYCGHCVTVCPVGAKRMREDLPRAKLLLARRESCHISIAPSWVSEFACSPGQMAAALLALGFRSAGETSIGAEVVSSAIRRSFSSSLSLSTACPAVTELVEKYYPRLASHLSPWKSPMLAHALMLKQRYGDKAGIVFAGPCIAKKQEGDKHEECVDVVLTFDELRRWFDDAGIDLRSIEPASFDGMASRGGSLYPVDGGMIASIKEKAQIIDATMISLSGTESIMRSLDDLGEQASGRPLFLEFLACKGGCINGPATDKKRSLVSKRLRVIETAARRSEEGEAASSLAPVGDEKLSKRWQADRGVDRRHFSSEEIESALIRLGKERKEDRLNCGGCGYHTCADFAAAWIEGKAEKAMCVASMRRIAQKKMNAIIKAIPLGVVIVDDEMNVVECNRKFLEFFSDFPPEEIDEVIIDNMVGRTAARFLPETEGIRRIQGGERELVEKRLEYRGRIMKVLIFIIERDRFTGVLFEDVTSLTKRRDTVIKNAEAVIAKNLATVQQIAGLLGESAAETEIILSSLIDVFKSSGGGGEGR